MTIQDLLKRVARGELSSCGGVGHDEYNITEDTIHDADKTKRSARLRNVNEDDNDDEYYYDDIPQVSSDSIQNGLENPGEVYTETPARVEDIMDQLGDADIMICDNLERALYLSLKYEFVTPLTSLVVVKPDSEDYGEFGEAGVRQRQQADQFNIMYSNDNQLHASSKYISCLLLMYLIAQCTVS